MNEESGGFGSGVVQMKALPSAADTVTVAGIEKDGKLICATICHTMFLQIVSIYSYSRCHC